MKTIHFVDTGSFALTGAPASPANTQAPAVDFPSDLQVLRMVSASRAARNTRVAALIRAGFNALGAKIAQWHQPRTTRQTLLTLDDHLLQDIGLDRADIRRFADNAAPGVIARFFAVLSKSVNGFVDAAIAWNKAQTTRSALKALSNAQLSDIGLSRHEVDLLAMDIRAGRWPTAEVKATAGKPAKRFWPVNANVSTHVNSWIMSPRKAA